MIAYAWHSISPSFSSASELKSALLGSFVQGDIDYSGGRPVILFAEGREWSGAPAWGWIRILLETRSDWWPALGIAIQHATDEHPLAREALEAALRDNPTSSLAILEWLVPLAEGKSDDLAKRIGELQVKWDEAEENGIRLGDNGEIVVATEADLEPAMKKLAPGGWSFELYGRILSPPWDWLRNHAYVHRWLAAAAPKACASFGLKDDITPRERSALLDYLLKEADLWMHRALFDAWATKPPKWWKTKAAVQSVKGSHRPDAWKAYADCGSIAAMMGARAVQQADTPVVLDLSPL